MRNTRKIEEFLVEADLKNTSLRTFRAESDVFAQCFLGKPMWCILGTLENPWKRNTIPQNTFLIEK